MQDSTNDPTRELKGLVKLLRARRDDVVSAWKTRVCAHLGDEGLAEAELRDQVPRVLDQLAAAIEATDAPRATETTAPHVHDRLQRGFDLSAIVRELALLREAIADTWDEAGGATSGASQRRLAELFDGMLAGTVRRHREEREIGRRALRQIVETRIGPDLDVFLPEAASRALAALRMVDSVAIFVIEDGVPRLRAHAAAASDLSPDEALAARALAEAKPICEAGGGGGVRARVVMPLMQDERVVGVAEMASRRVDVFTEDELIAFRAMSNRACATLAQHRLHELERQATRELARADALLDGVFSHAPVGLGFAEHDLRYVRVNDALAAMNGVSRERHIGRTAHEIIPELAPSVESLIREVVATRRALIDVELRGRTAAHGEEERVYCASYFPVADDHATPGVGICVRDVTDERRRHLELATHARQQRMVAELGVRALRARTLDEVFRDVVSTLRETLGTDFAKVLELEPDRRNLLLRASVGFDQARDGETRVTAGRGSQAGYTLESREPVIAADVEHERRFVPPDLLVAHGVRSGISVVIETDVGSPFGVLGTHTRAPRAFTSSDAAFVQAVANIAGAAILRFRSDARADSAQRAGAVQRMLSDVSRTLATATTSVETVESALADVARRMVPLVADDVAVLTRDERDGGDGYACLHAASAYDDDLSRRTASLVSAELAGGGDLGRSLSTGASLLVDSTERAPQTLPALAAAGVRSIAAVPLRTAHGTRGALLLTTRARPLDDGDLDVAEEVARRCVLAAENARLLAETRDAVRAREEILGIVSHDLRNPVNTVGVTATALARPDIDPSRLHAYGDVLGRAAARMRRLIDDLVDFDAIRSGRLSLSPRTIEPRVILDEAALLFASVADERQIALEIELSPGTSAVRADLERVVQVLSNLVGNAIRVTPPGGTITLRAAPAEGAVVFSVRDTGPGIDARELEDIFERYRRGTAGEQYRGTGLGLAIARGIVEAHGGRIWADTSPGKGACFFFTVPTAA